MNKPGNTQSVATGAARGARRFRPWLAGAAMVFATPVLAAGAAAGVAVMQTAALVIVTFVTIHIVLSAYRAMLLARAQSESLALMRRGWDLRVQALEQRLHLEVEEETHKWDGYRKFEVVKAVPESPDESVVSFYLAPHDKGPLPRFKPGQYLTFSLNIHRDSKPVLRCYSLSDAYHPDYYRVSIKKLVRPPLDESGDPIMDTPPEKWESGTSSGYFHEVLRNLDITVDVKAPSGEFYLEVDRMTSVVLIAGGVGLTPMVSMLNTLLAAGSKREIWFFYGVVCGSQHAMKEYLEQVARENENVHLCVVYSNPEADDRLLEITESHKSEGRKYEQSRGGDEDYHFHGRVGVDLFKQCLSSSNYEYYMCGPPPMMQSVYDGLMDWGVPEDDIHFEAFGPASVKRRSAQATEIPPGTTIRFASSGKTAEWVSLEETPNLLKLGDRNGVEISRGCMRGACGCCQTAVVEGDVQYPNGKPEFEFEKGCCLPCVGVPKGSLVLDA